MNRVTLMLCFVGGGGGGDGDGDGGDGGGGDGGDGDGGGGDGGGTSAHLMVPTPLLHVTTVPDANVLV